MRNWLFYVFAVWLGWSDAYAQPVIGLTKEQRVSQIGTQTDWLVDTSARLTINDIQSPSVRDKFHLSARQTGSFGLTRAAIWVHGRFTCTDGEKVFLLADFANIDSLTLYYYKDGQLQTAVSGSTAPLKDKVLNIPGFIFEIPVAPGHRPQEFWLRARTGNAMILPLSLTTATGLQKALASMNIIVFIYMGVVMALFFYNLSIAWWMKDRAYFLYLGYLFFLATYVMLYLRGVHVWTGQTLSYAINQFGVGFAALSYFFIIYFSIHFMKSDVHTPALSRILRIIAWYQVIPIACILLGWRHAAIRQAELLSLLIPVLFIWMAVKGYQRNNKPALYYMIAFGLLLTAIVLFAMANLGLLPFGKWVLHILPIGSAVEVVLLSLALGYRYALAEKEKNRLQAIQLEFAQEQRQLLEQQVRERTKDLETAMEQLQESNRAKDKLLSIIAHDIRSPLNNLAGYLELAERKVMEAGQIKQFIPLLRRNISQIGRTMNNLLNWSLIHKEHIRTIPSDVPLAPMARQLMDTYRFTAEQKGVELRMDIPENLAVVADSPQLELVLRNLLDNAIKFTPKGGSVMLGCRPAADQVVVYVADTGEGMTQEAASQLLQRTGFYTTGRTGDKGTGLGLQLCREFVASNGGHLEVFSRPGEGTEFNFTLRGKWLTP